MDFFKWIYKNLVLNKHSQNPACTLAYDNFITFLINFMKKFLVKKEIKGRIGILRNFITINIRYFCWDLTASKLILLFKKIGLKIDIRFPSSTRF